MTFLVKWRVSKTIQWLVKVFFIYLFIFTTFRVATVFFFKPSQTSWTELLPSFWLGLKYDLRWIAFLLMPVAFFSLFPRLSPFFSERGKKFWTFYLGFVTLLVLFFYGADFGQFSYANSRLNAEALVFTAHPKESFQMVWQSYPVIWILIGVIGAMLMMVWMFKKVHVGVTGKNINVHKFDYRRRWSLIAILVLCWFMYGFFTARPLNFFRAFNLDNEFKSNLALNPLQNFFTTLRFQKQDENADAKRNYPRIAKFLGIKKTPEGSDPYLRLGLPGSRALEGQPNVVLVLCESFSMYKSSMSGNPLNATPYFNGLSKKGIFFERCFATSFGTARALFATLTGIPDVRPGNLSARNESSLKKRTIINDFEGYEKMYFVGGRSQFNNYSSLIKNVSGVKIYEEGHYRSPKFNVWGISDKNLFLEANAVMSQQQKPFFSIIQMANNQRPYAIPPEDTGFVRRFVSEDELEKYGFESLEEFHAFAYTDYCIGKFMEAASGEAYFDNTIFVFLGDHGVEGRTGAFYPPAWNEQRLSEEHVPFLIYSPGLISPRVYSKVVSQIDVLPTVAGLVQQPYTNTSLGRNVLDSTSQENIAFIIYHAPGWIGVVNDDYFFRKNIRMQKEEMVPVKTPSPVYSQAQQDSIRRNLSELTTAIYETSKWMLMNNR